MNVRKFRLIGRTTVFVAIKFYQASGFIPAVIGRTEDGRFQTTAREADVIFFD